MSVDWAECKSCGKSVCDCGDDWNSCGLCDRIICSGCLVEADTPQYIEDKEDITDEQYKYLCNKYGKDKVDSRIIGWGMNPEYCPFCSGTEVHNDDLLEFCLGKLGITKDEAVKMYRGA